MKSPETMAPNQRVAKSARAIRGAGIPQGKAEVCGCKGNGADGSLKATQIFPGI